MLTNYYNSAILYVKELSGGIDKLERLNGETHEEYIKRRRAYYEHSKRKKR